MWEGENWKIYRRVEHFSYNGAQLAYAFNMNAAKTFHVYGRVRRVEPYATTRKFYVSNSAAAHSPR